jgi:tight adherence protein C
MMDDLGVLLPYILPGVAAAVLGFLLLSLSGNARFEARFNNLTDSSPKAERKGLGTGLLAMLQDLGTWLLPRNESRRSELAARFARAGLYGRTVVPLFLAAKTILSIVLPLPVLAYSVRHGFNVITVGLMAAAVAAGYLLPSLWLDKRTAWHANELRRGLPDALDMLVLCVEGGLTLMAAVSRVARELGVVHPVLAIEILTVHREIMLGRTTGDALDNFARRCDLEEVRSLALVVQQADRYGSSVAQALRLHSEAFRLERRHQAEEKAQRAAVTILFPTLLCIFPAVFTVLLGPAATQLARLFGK